VKKYVLGLKVDDIVDGVRKIEN